jgi:hypothetical protein
MEDNTMSEIKKSTAETKKVKIKLPKIKGQPDDVFVSVNNYTCVIKRGEEVEVPAFVKEVLDHQEEMLDIISAFENKNIKK